MKFLIIPFCLCFISSYAQINTDKLYGNWVVSTVTYKDGTPLGDDNPLKYSYLKYRFQYPDKLNVSTAFYERGEDRSFEIKKNFIELKSPEGFVINKLLVKELNSRLILLQAGYGGFDDPSSLLFTCVSEEEYQKNILLNSNDIQSIYGRDTTFVECPKIYASYKGSSFQRYIYNGIADRISMDHKVGHLFATFIVSKKGLADSLRIIEGIAPDFDKRFVKVFSQAKNDWTPGILNGKYVNVLMKVDLRYSTSETEIPAYLTGQKALVAYNDKNYSLAEYYYDKALTANPTDKEFLFRRGMCKLFLGNKEGACEDWYKAKSLGSTVAIDAIIEKFCR